MEVIVCCRF